MGTAGPLGLRLSPDLTVTGVEGGTGVGDGSVAAAAGRGRLAIATTLPSMATTFAFDSRMIQARRGRSGPGLLDG